MQTLEEYCGKYKEEGEEFKTLINGVLPDGWADELPTFTEKDKPLATRLHSQTMLNALAPVLPGFWGGSAGQFTSPCFAPCLHLHLCQTLKVLDMSSCCQTNGHLFSVVELLDMFLLLQRQCSSEPAFASQCTVGLLV